VKKGRHRRFEEARAMKRSQDVDFDALFDSLRPDESDGDEVDDDDRAVSSELDDDWDDEDDDS
jgi:hypothetical protein